VGAISRAAEALRPVASTPAPAAVEVDVNKAAAQLGPESQVQAHTYATADLNDRRETVPAIDPAKVKAAAAHDWSGCISPTGR
jgi:hypothetical protein